MLWASWEPCGAKLWEPYLAKKIVGILKRSEENFLGTLREPWSKAVGTLGQPWSKVAGTFDSLWNLGKTLRGKVVEILW